MEGHDFQLGEPLQRKYATSDAVDITSLTIGRRDLRQNQGAAIWRIAECQRGLWPPRTSLDITRAPGGYWVFSGCDCTGRALGMVPHGDSFATLHITAGSTLKPPTAAAKPSVHLSVMCTQCIQWGAMERSARSSPPC